MSAWVEKLSARGYRITPQRRIIVNVLNKSQRHLTAEEISIQVRKTEPSISLATIYRNLNLLAKLQMVCRLDIHDGPVRYGIYSGHNHHLVCMECGTAVQLGVCPMQGEIKRIVEESGFEVDGHHFEITGYCPECSAKRRLQQDKSAAQGGADCETK